MEHLNTTYQDAIRIPSTRRYRIILKKIDLEKERRRKEEAARRKKFR